MPYHDYDLTPAVIARRTLLLEARSNEERAALVWQPTQVWLEALASASPTALTCCTGEPYHFPRGTAGWCMNLYALNRDRQVAYLGTLFTPLAARDDRRREVARLEKIDTYAAERLATCSRTAIIRNRCFCKIPVTGENLDEGVLTNATRSYLRTFTPPLASLPIHWLPRNEGAILDQEIWERALATARRSPEDEHLHKTAADELWE